MVHVVIIVIQALAKWKCEAIFADKILRSWRMADQKWAVETQGRFWT